MRKNEILDKKETLRKTAETLKKEFIGLNDIIDEIIGLISPWYLFPGIQLRPSVINLWGMTGSGKTALLNRMVELIDFKSHYVQFDMGEFESDSASWIKNILTDDLEYLNKQPCIICFDEFQFARSLDKDGVELGKDKLRVIWDIIDSGKINFVPSYMAYYQMRADLCIQLLMKYKDKGGELKDGIAEDKDGFIEILGDYYFSNYKDKSTKNEVNYFISDDFINGLFFLNNKDEITEKDIRDMVILCNVDSLMNLIRQFSKSCAAVRQLDLSNSIIFIVGNLDEAYYMSSTLNPDISADELYQATLKINISNIKAALKKRFRNEQIARLGNNHIIYRSFTNKHFMSIISGKLNQLNEMCKDRFGFNIDFDDSVLQLVYDEGVFPAQGTRPVLTTINNLIEGTISKIVVETLLKNIRVNRVKWLAKDNVFEFIFLDEDNRNIGCFSETLNLKISSMRKTSNPEDLAHTSVHEAGHAIMAALTLRIIPALVVSKTAASEAEGFCLVNLPEGPFTMDVIEKDMMIGLGGLIAERLVFGKKGVSSGVSGDIENVTNLANRAIKEYAMGKDPLLIKFMASQDDQASVHTKQQSRETLKLVKSCEKKASRILKRNSLLLLKLAEQLTLKSRMEEAEIKKIVVKYAREKWVNENAFIKKEDYFKFSTTIQSKLKSNSSAKVNLNQLLRFFNF